MKNVADIYPLSPLQQGMLFHSLYAPDSGVYIVQMSYELSGKLDKIAFANAWQQIVDRHPILRTAFIWEKLEQPLQVVGHSVKAPVEYKDWRDHPNFTDELARFLAAQRQEGFLLSKAPLMRLTIIEQADNTYHFLWCYHHILLDGWSVPLILRDFLSFYSGKTPPDPPPRPYRDYIAWLQQQERDSALQFWRQYLQGFTTPTDLGLSEYTNHLKSQEKSYQERQREFSEDFTREAQTFAREQQLTLNTLIQGAWALLLGCYSGEDDLVFGTTVSGRPGTLAGAEEMVGLFINTLPVRVNLGEAGSLLLWLKRLQSQQLERQAYESTPLVEIHRVSEVSGNLPLFESLVIFENYPLNPTLRESSLEIRKQQTREQNNFPLTLYGMVNPRLTLRLSYEEGRFDPDQLTRLLEHLENLLVTLVRFPEKRLADLAFLTPGEYQFLQKWHDSSISSPVELCFHQLFEAQAAKNPEAVAIVAAEKLTYEELNRRANQLAHHLIRLGLKPESPIGICLEPSLSMVVALIAVFKAGGAYVPLDPTYPRDRLTLMVKSAACTVIICQEKLLPVLPLHSAEIICLDRDWVSLSPESDDRFPLVVPEQLAYIIFTSGSTGQPKGVQILHKSLVNLLLSLQQTLQITSEDVLLAVTTLAFDIAALELFLPLCVGAQVVLAGLETVRDGARLQEQLQQGITIMQGTPSTWRLLIEAGWCGKRDLQILCGGEPLTPDLAENLMSRGKMVWNLYGPTETTIWSSVYLLEGLGVSLGYPIAHTQFYLLDGHLNLVPPGVPGELYIGGQGLARGYLNRPDLTAQQFIPHPFAPSQRLYRTGDRMRVRSDGQLEYLGRTDNRVKLRGFRLELEEIETELQKHPDIQAAVVGVQEDTLLAYLEGTKQSPESLRAFLGEKLPPYMIPSYFVFLDALPLTLNGKIDRKALAKLEKIRPALVNSYVKPHTETEAAITRIWQEVLGLEQIGIQDNFFDLGGHSMLMIRVLSLLKEAFNKDLSLVDLFRYPNIEALAAYFNRDAREESGQEISRQQLDQGRQKLRQRRQRREEMEKNG